MPSGQCLVALHHPMMSGKFSPLSGIKLLRSCPPSRWLCLRGSLSVLDGASIGIATRKNRINTSAKSLLWILQTDSEVLQSSLGPFINISCIDEKRCRFKFLSKCSLSQSDEICPDHNHIVHRGPVRGPLPS